MLFFPKAGGASGNILNKPHLGFAGWRKVAAWNLRE